MTTSPSALHGIIVISMLAAAGAFAAGAEPSHGAGAAAWGPGTEAAGAGPVLAPEADAPFVAPADTVRFSPGALLDVWMNDDRRDLRAITSERSLGTAVMQGDFFRYTSINADADLRGYWGQHLVLKWSAYLEVAEPGLHVFVSELSKERNRGAIRVRTLVRVNEVTVFERQVREFGSNQIFEVASYPLPLARGYHRLEVWLSVSNGLSLPPG